jgi:hypothetical protein
MRYKNLAVFVALALSALTRLSALVQTCPTNVPHITGTWTVLPYQIPINPISANLLPNGKLLIVAGSEKTRAYLHRIHDEETGLPLIDLSH